MIHHSLVNLLYPARCLLCHGRLTQTASVICQACASRVSPCLPPVCQRCGISLHGAFDARVVCARCQRHPPTFDQARAPFLYEGVIREAVHAFKYHQHHRIGLWLAGAMAQIACREFAAVVEVVVPVPLFWAKARWRGINPSDSLARVVAQTLHRPREPHLLRRRRWTTSQTRLSRQARARNVHEAFWADPSRLAARQVLLIDDVLTTGATAHACAHALRKAGAQRITVLTAACAAL